MKKKNAKFLKQGDPFADPFAANDEEEVFQLPQRPPPQAANPFTSAAQQQVVSHDNVAFEADEAIPLSSAADAPMTSTTTDAAPLQFQESQLPRSVFGKMMAKKEKRDAAAAAASPDAPPSSSSAPPTSTPPPPPQGDTGGFFSLGRYRKFFDVDTWEVLHRCIMPMYRFWKPDFFVKAEANPDLYGPFWVASTLIFLTAVTGNLSSYIDYKVRHPGESGSYAPPTPSSFSPPPSNGTAMTPPAPGALPPSAPSSNDDNNEEGTIWYYDVNKVSAGFVIFYLYISVVPFLFWAMMRYFKTKLRLVQVICIYGYSLSLFLPATILNVIPVSAARWVITAVATVLSGCFLVVNFGGAIKRAADESASWMGQSALGSTFVGRLSTGALAMVMCSIVLGLHLGLGLLLKLYFYSFTKDY